MSYLWVLLPIGKNPLSAKGITGVTTYNHPIDICSVFLVGMDALK